LENALEPLAVEPPGANGTDIRLYPYGWLVGAKWRARRSRLDPAAVCPCKHMQWNPTLSMPSWYVSCNS